MDPNWTPFHPNPSKPTFKPPAGAVDAHCHVFGPADDFPYAPERKYTPCDAPKAKLFELRDYLGFDKNVIVQASCHSKDNRALVDALENSNGKARGVAFVGQEVEDLLRPVAVDHAPDGDLDQRISPTRRPGYASASSGTT